MSSEVRLAAMIPATCAVAMASPFRSSRSCRAVSAAIVTVAAATARRRETGFEPTSTMWISPESSTCEKSAITRDSAGRARRGRAGAARPPLRDGRNRSRTAPPGDRDVPRIPVGELHLHAFVQAVLRVGAAEPRVLVSAPRSLARRVRVLKVVRPHRADLEARCDASRPLAVARPDARAQAKRGVVRELHRVLLVTEGIDGDNRPEDLLLREGGLAADTDQHRRFVEPAR